MPGNTFGKIFRLTSFGESHGKAIGGVITGCPSGVKIDVEFIQNELRRRKPGQSQITTPRNEGDEVEFLSGIFEGVTLGTPIGFIVPNKDSKSKDYSRIKNIYRPSHADYTYQQKYGIKDYRGGGRSSARETIARVAAGAIAKLILKQNGIAIHAYTSQVGNIALNKPYHQLNLSKTEDNIIRCPDQETAIKMIKRIEEVRDKGDTIGGIITCIARNVPAGLGEPVFDKLHARLVTAMLSINAVKGFEYGSGFQSVNMLGSEHNDRFYTETDPVTREKKLRTKTNYSGGIQGGISNGEDIYFKTVFKPVATIMQEQKSVDIEKQETVLHPKGRHDPCVLPRAVPIVEAMTALVLVDFYLLNNLY